ncbi:P-loop containing nucleoside triphosphate hydrolase protein [Irpex rosettiformis]|uniref:P-loop containing nucleoside triphosphate hydrolase protein n=1 Tax=Irpex rosettiformis TaxID=378272 RepID=A0ACB8TMZ8_9APHY|nr:P-loop containing nucleoside triphosphate hydrolase protein [Irpex rosettiformis]
MLLPFQLRYHEWESSVPIMMYHSHGHPVSAQISQDFWSTACTNRGLVGNSIEGNSALIADSKGSMQFCMKHTTHKKKSLQWGLHTKVATIQQRPKLSSMQIRELEEKLCQAYKHDPYSFQLEAIQAQIEGKNVLVHAATGAGKTTITAGPHAWILDGVTLIATPLIQLAEEMVNTFREEFGLAVISIHSKNGVLSPAKDILDGKYKVILASPEMMQTRTFIDKLSRNQKFVHKFRKKYMTLGNLRAFLPSSTSVIAVLATLTARVCRDIQSKLHFSKANSSFIDIGNN